MSAKQIIGYNEYWKVIKTKRPTVRSNYFISNFGRIKKKNKSSGIEELVSSRTHPKGHLIVGISVKAGVETFNVNRLVAESFIKGRTKDRNLVIYIDGNKKNCKDRNLRWGSRADLTNHQKKLGVFEGRMPPHKLSESNVKLIKKRIKSGKTKRKIIARQFGVTVEQVRRIEKGECWAHVTI